MAIVFRRITCAPLREFDAAAPDGAVIGLAGANGSGKGLLMELAAGTKRPVTGTIEKSGAVRLLRLGDALDLSPAPVLLIDQALAHHDPLVRERAFIALDRMRRSGSTILLASHEEDVLRRLADEVWWLHDGRLAGRGDPEEILSAYRHHVAESVRAWGESMPPQIAPHLRRGDGRAEIVGIEMLGENGHPTVVWRSGELAVVKVRVRFREAVEDPVIGMMIRTRIGLNVYGTNTELEKLRLGPRAAGDRITVTFGYRCDLCPQEYTLTIASHDPDGVWHDWLEDAVAFSVSDSRYTAGVANLHATVSFTL